MMATAGDDYSFTSPGKSFEVDKPKANAFEEVMAKIDSPFREAGRTIQRCLFCTYTSFDSVIRPFWLQSAWRRNGGMTKLSRRVQELKGLQLG